MTRDKMLLRLQQALPLESAGGASEQSATLPQAAVLVLLKQLEAEPEVLLTRRADHMRLHAGEVAFPGGRCDTEDSNHWVTALREANEEVALPARQVEQLGTMAPVVTRTGIEVTPCVGRLLGEVKFEPNPQELDTIFSVPLEFLADASNLSFDSFEYAGAQRQVPRYDYQQYCIWGITAAMLVRLVNITHAAQLPLGAYWRNDT
ncbi:CoA pyrophosphatase [Halieaceae bacterium IMCC14734]|uniref:CoA pyrophosphatase n=1 Tax=Candidatus Litorirhabdus singularis TaxID=2518993 RepID=A0ABT3THP9_9GAMM|nr:CoA pyrophosphatase [Candidatus Litorirhabdus singularis]MCX2981801.1 CoA pyrophosphatase [Candidatus Litorirhabdus singularis]